MIAERPALRPWTVGAVAFLVTVCMSPLVLVEPITREVGTGVSLWYALAIVAALVGVEFNARLVRSDLVPWADWLRTHVAPWRAAFFLLGAAFMLTVWLNVLAATELPDTPRAVSSMLVLVVVAYTIRLGLEATMNLVGLLALVVAPMLVLSYLGIVPAMRAANLLPIAPLSVPWLWPLITFMCRGFDVIPVAGPHVRGAFRTAVLVGVGSGAVLLTLTMLAPVLVFGAKVTAEMAYPYIRTIGIVTSPYLPFQRVQFVTFITWQMISFGIVAAYSICGLASLGVPVHPLTPWRAVLPWTASVLAISLYVMPPDVSVRLKTLWSVYGLILYYAVPALVLAFGRTGRPREPAVA